MIENDFSSKMNETDETAKPQTSENPAGRYGGLAVGAAIGGLVVAGPLGSLAGGIIAGGLTGGVIGGALERWYKDETALPEAVQNEIKAVRNEVALTAQQIEPVVKALGLDKTIVGTIISALSGIGEAAIYAEEGLKGVTVNGEAALVRTDINMDQVDTVRGWTNAERIEHGLPPLTPNGEPVELHRIGQKSDGPFAEVTNTLLGNVTAAANLFQRAAGVVSELKDFGQDAFNYWRGRTITTILTGPLQDPWPPFPEKKRY